MFAFGIILVTILFSGLAYADWKPVYVQPQQIHLSLGGWSTIFIVFLATNKVYFVSFNVLDNPRSMVVTWVTFDKTFKSTVWYGTDKLDQVAYGTPSHGTLFTDGGPAKRTMYIHRVYINDLKPETLYSKLAI